MAVFSATQCASDAPIPRFKLRFSLISSLSFEIDQGYLYVFCTFRHDLPIGAIKTEIFVCGVSYVRVLYLVFVPKMDFAISGKILSHIFVVFRDRPGLPICFQHIPTRFIDWHHKIRPSTFILFWDNYPM